jgi:aminoglycoside-2''-adenylyltransferase
VADTRLGRWEPFDVATVERIMAGADVLWWLSGGEALDVFLGRSTRAHCDIDISVRRSDFSQLREFLAGKLDVKIARDGVLSELGDEPLDDRIHGLWARQTDGGPWRLQINLEPVIDGEWIFRRDPRIRRPVHEVVWRRATLSYVNPAVQLLWKVKEPQEKDEQDRAVIVPALPDDERRWLAEMISRSYPNSSWATKIDW